MSRPVCPVCNTWHDPWGPCFITGNTASPTPSPYQYQVTGGYKPEEGWINRQVERVERESQTWPEWMRRETATGDTWTPRDTHNAEIEAAGGADLQLARAVQHIKKIEAENATQKAQIAEMLEFSADLVRQRDELGTRLTARIATLEEALNRVHRLVCFEMAEPPSQGTGTLITVATVVEEALGEAIAERGGL